MLKKLLQKRRQPETTAAAREEAEAAERLERRLEAVREQAARIRMEKGLTVEKRTKGKG